MPATKLIRLVMELGAPYGMERSVKLMPQALASDRCLISLSRAAFGKNPTERVVQIVEELGIPKEFYDELPASLDRADIVHFGYEAEAGRDVYKIYFEYAAQARRAMTAPNPAPVLVHLAYKWTQPFPNRGAVTRYTWMPCRNRPELEARIRELVPVNEAAIALRCALNLVSKTSGFADKGKLLLMAVDELGNPRRSCDLNVYDAGLHLNQIADLLDEVVMDFGVGEARDVFERAKNLTLGHLSAGVGRDGREFVTVYFGVEAH